MLNGKAILVTGGTGTFGKAFTKYVLENYDPKKIIIYSRDEFKQFNMQNDFREHADKLRFFIGDVRDKSVVLVDDMIDTAGTLCNAAKAIVDAGSTEVIACATHAVLSGPAIERIDQSVIKELVLLDTVPIPEDKMLDKFTILPVAPVFADAIERIYADKPVSTIGQ
jgi:ribose-phosphate pyrophosphokinase